MGFRRLLESFLGTGSTTPAPATEMQRWQTTLQHGARLRRQQRYDEALETFDGVLAEARQVKNTVAVATVLGHIGALYTEQSRWDEAHDALSQATEIAREQDNAVLLAAVLNDWAAFLLAKGEKDTAQKSFEEALASAQRGTDTALTAHILAQLADIYLDDQNATYARRLLEEANHLTRFQNPAYFGRIGEATIASGHEVDGHRWVVQALRLSHATGNVEQEITWANVLAGRYKLEGKLHEAQRLYQRVAMLLPKGTFSSKEAHTRYLLDRADVSYQVGQYEDAVRYAEEGIPMAEDLHLMSEVARANGVLGAAYRAMGERDQAIGHLQTALSYVAVDAPAARSIGLRLELARVQQDTAPETAIETYEQVIEAARAAGENSELARALIYLGRLEHNRHASDRALSLWREAQHLLESDSDYQRLAPLLCDIANLVKERGDRKQALTLYEQALMALNNVNHPHTRGLVLSNVANMYTDTGDVETAQAFYEEAIKIARDMGDKVAESLRLGNLGWFYVMTGQPRQAIPTLDRALVISRKLDSMLMQAVQRDNLALAYARISDYATAEDLHQQALDLVEGDDQQRWQAVFHSNFGETLARQHRYDEALSHYEIALRIGNEVQESTTIVRTLWRLGDLQRETGELDAAAANYEKAIYHARQIGAQRDLAHAVLGQGMLAVVQEKAEQARRLLDEARRLLIILHAPEQQQAEQALKQVA